MRRSPRAFGLCLVAAFALTAGAALAQDAGDMKTSTFEPTGLADASGALLRGLDKISAQPTDIRIAKGQTVTYGQLLVTLRECRYPADDPSSNAYAYLTIREATGGKVDFQGWMVADSPALNALDHPRYDVWVIRCNNS